MATTIMRIHYFDVKEKLSYRGRVPEYFKEYLDDENYLSIKYWYGPMKNGKMELIWKLDSAPNQMPRKKLYHHDGAFARWWYDPTNHL